MAQQCGGIHHVRDKARRAELDAIERLHCVAGPHVPLQQLHLFDAFSNVALKKWLDPT